MLILIFLELHQMNYICVWGYTNKNFLTDIRFENNPDLEDPDFSMNQIDLNETTDGTPIYMYTSKMF